MVGILRVDRERRMAGWTGLEPAASGVTGRRSNQLNYHPTPSGLSALGPVPMATGHLGVRSWGTAFVTERSDSCPCLSPAPASQRRFGPPPCSTTDQLNHRVSQMPN